MSTGSASPGGEARADAAPTVDGVAAGRVVRPATVEEACAEVRRADEHGLALVATGRGRHLAIGAPPVRVDVLLALDRLAAVGEHAAADMTVTVQAGCTVASLQETLAATGQWLPIDPPAPEETTVGGLVAADLSGPLRASQGTVRDLLLGLAWIAPDGTLVRGGGRVVKNVAGYDIAKAHVGALGTLGVLVEATFKVRPRPRRERALVLPATSARDATALALALRDAIEPDWLEIASPLDGAGGLAWALVAGRLGLAEELDDAERRTRALLGERTVAVHEDAAAAALRLRLADFPLATEAAAVARVAVLPDRLGTLLDDVARACASAPPLVAHAANGVARVRLATADDALAVVRDVRPAAERAGGILVVERARPDVKHLLRPHGGPWGDPGPGRELMRGVKRAFDPRGTFAPGRFVAEI